jgi:hypothetical protein
MADGSDSGVICGVINGAARAWVLASDHGALHSDAARMNSVLCAVVQALDTLAVSIETEHPQTAEEKLVLFRRAYRHMSRAFDELTDREQRAVLADTQPAPLDDL